MTVARIWNGSSWVYPSGWNIPRVWDGSAWVSGLPNVWFGPNNPTKSLTVGSQYNPGSKYVAASTNYGYGEASYGSLNTIGMPYAWNDHTIISFDWQSGSFNDQVFKIMLRGTDIAYNTGWTSVSFNGYTFNRSAAGFTSSSITYSVLTQWAWTGITTNPFPADGTTINVTWNV